MSWTPNSGAQMFFRRQRMAALARGGVTVNGEIVEGFVTWNRGHARGVRLRSRVRGANAAARHQRAFRFDPSDPRNAALVSPIS
jgi:hypothetical protein